MCTKRSCGFYPAMNIIKMHTNLVVCKIITQKSYKNQYIYLLLVLCITKYLCSILSVYYILIK